METNSSAVKFQTLDALRFFAFLRVFLLHIPVFDNVPFFNAIKDGGEIGVGFFFVLSGFLITYLLAREKKLTGAVNAKQFMLRRIFRIWPLYYLGVALAFANVFFSRHYGFGSGEGYTPNILFSITFLENIKMLIEDNFPNGAPLRVFWSLCVEEQFYILWMLLFRFVPLKQLAKIFGALIIAAWCYRIFITPLLQNQIITDTDLVSKLDYFCMGGFLGLSMVLYPQTINKLRGKITSGVQMAVIIICFAFFFFKQLMPGSFLKSQVYFPAIAAIVFTVLIACFVINQNRFQISNNSLLGKWGNISYGLYVYHTPVILVAMLLFKKMQLQSSAINIAMLVVSTFTVTLFISHLSYYYFERPLLQLRDKYFPTSVK